MAGALKQTFLEAVRLTPEGIDAFLETPLPTAPTVSPSDDTANEALASFLLDVFRPFAGLTPVELLLRIGQHNSVLESAMIAGLEYLEGSDSDENTVTIFEPIEGTAYAPGEMRFSCSVSNGKAIGVNLKIGDGESLKMFAEDNLWRQFVLVTPADTTATMTATMDDNSQVSATVNFIVEDTGTVPPLPGEQPEPPGGKDTSAIQRAYQVFMNALKKFLDALYSGVQQDELIAAFEKVVEAFEGLQQVAASAGDAATTALNIIGNALNAARSVIEDQGGEASEAIAKLMGEAANAVRDLIVRILN